MLRTTYSQQLIYVSCNDSASFVGTQSLRFFIVPLGSTVAFTASARPHSSTITGMRGAAGEHQPAAAVPPCTKVTCGKAESLVESMELSNSLKLE